MILRLPYPPSNNRYYRHFRGRTVIGAEGRGYRLDVLGLRPRSGWPIEGRLRMRIDVHPSRAVSQDLDNIPKCVCDSLQHAGIYADDNQIDELVVRRMPKITGGGGAHIVVTVERVA